MTGLKICAISCEWTPVTPAVLALSGVSEKSIFSAAGSLHTGQRTVRTQALKFEDLSPLTSQGPDSGQLKCHETIP